MQKPLSVNEIIFSRSESNASQPTKLEAKASRKRAKKFCKNQILHDIFMWNSKRYEKWRQDTAKVRKMSPGWAKVKERAPKVSQRTPKMSQKGAKGSQKGAKSEPAGAKSEPTGAKSEPKGRQREPKGSQKVAKRAPKVSQRATKMHQKVDLRKRSRKRRKKGCPLSVIGVDVWAMFH